MAQDKITRFARRLTGAGRRRVPLDTIWQAYHEVYRPAAEGAAARAALKSLLNRLCEQGFCSLPSERGKCWDRTSTVVLPLWVVIADRTEDRQERDWRTYAWHPELSWVPELASLSRDQEDFLKALQHALVHGGLRDRAPFKYRSLQLTGDEKRLKSLLNTQLFGPGRLDLDLLNCDGQTLPLAWERVGEGARMIVFENAGSFLVARGALLNAANPPYGLIAYGGGNQVVRTAAYVSEISDQLSIDYVGDLDAHGIEIALRFADAVRRETGFPIRPAARVHEAMLQAAAELGHPQGWPAGSARKTTRIQDWLPPEYAEDAAAIIQTGNRIPEEVLHGGHYRREWSNPGHGREELTGTT